MLPHILLVDDTPVIRVKYEALLRHAGFEVTTASGGQEALELLGPGHPYDLVISDLKMPGMDGLGLVTEMRGTASLMMLPVLMLTGSEDQQDLLVNLDAGVSDYVLKSCDKHELLARVRNLARMKQLQDELERASRTDALTELSNRRHGVERLTEEIGRARRYDRDLSVVLLDIDHFKRINDTLGHQSGDEVLVEVARRLRATSRESDCVIRWGGEEFLFVFPETDIEAASGIIDRFRRELAGRAVEVWAEGGVSIDVTVSGGVAALRDGDTMETLVDRADGALYQAKEDGRNRILAWRGEGVVPVGA